MTLNYAKKRILEAVKSGKISIEDSVRLLRQLADGQAVRQPLDEPPGVNASAQNSLLYRSVWTESPQPERPPQREGRVAVIHHSKLGKAAAVKLIELLGRDNVVEVELDPRGLGQGGETRYAPPYFDALVSRLDSVETIYFLGGVIDPVSELRTPEELDSLGEKSLLSLFHLVKALNNAERASSGVKLKIVTNNVQTFSYRDRTFPYAAPVIGLGQVVGKEFPDIETLCIDVDLREAVVDSTQLEAVAKILIAERGFGGAEIMHRAGRRYVREILPYIASATTNRIAFKRGGVYIIIGAGGIAAEIATHLVEKYQASVVLAARRSRDSFYSGVAAEKRPSIDYLQGDVTSIESMQEVIAETKRRYGSINGILHCAIVLDDGAIENLTEARFKDALGPKVRGTWVLGEVTKNEQLDFIALFSSATGIFCSAGQGGYVAGCRFKDAYAQYLNGLRNYPVLTINWGYWGEVGVVADDKYRTRLQRGGIYALTTAEGVETLERVLSLNEGQLIPIKLDANGEKNLGVATGAAVVAKPVVLEGDAGDLTAKVIGAIGTYPPVEPDVLKQVALLNTYVKLSLVRIFHEKKIFFATGNFQRLADIKQKLNVIDKYDRLLAALLYVLEQEGVVQSQAGGYGPTAQYYALSEEYITEKLKSIRLCLETGKDLSVHFTLVKECLRKILPILNGAVNAVHVIFPEGSMRLVEGFYKQNRLADYCNVIAAKMVGKLVESLVSAKRRVRIVEIGAGTGGGSKFIFEEIEKYGEWIDYYYTDVSRGFLNYANHHYVSKYPFIKLQELDIEKSPEEQGFEEAAYDIVFAANVLHATRSIAETLKNVNWLVKGGGALLLNEITSLQPFTTITFGLLDGWWAHVDSERRLPFTPLLDRNDWETALNGAGFSDVAAIGVEDREGSGYSQHVILGEGAGVQVAQARRLATRGDEGWDDPGGARQKRPEQSSDDVDGLKHQRVILSKAGRIEEIGVAAFTPSAPKSGEVLIRVHACALNFADLLSVKGLYPNMPDYPFTPGMEVSGVILACGDSVMGFEPGQEVIAVGGMGFGGLSSLVNVDVRNVVEKPRDISHEEACAFPVAFLTAHHALQRAGLRRREKILIQTAAGGVGLVALQLARENGAEIFATAGSKEKLDYLKAQGVTHTINYRTEDFFERIMTITKGYGVDVVLNTLAGDAIQKGVDLLAPNGRYVEIAMAGLRQTPALNIGRLTDNQAIISVDLARLVRTRPDLLSDYLAEMALQLREGRVKPTVGRTFSCASAQDAFRCLEQRQNIGKVVVQMPIAQGGGSAALDLADQDRDIAIVGMAGRFPQANNIDEFFENLKLGTVCITEPPSRRWSFGELYNPDRNAKGVSYSKWGGFLDEIDRFDPAFFNVSGREAEMMDPQQRLFLEEAWKAIEDAGFTSDDLMGAKFGVYVGVTGGDYQLALHERGGHDNGYSFTGNSPAILAGRISYFLNLKGPSLAIDTACSSSLVAIHQACQSLRSGESDLALAGGVYLMCTPKLHVLTSQTGMLSPTGVCSAFDKRANGFVPGEAVVAVVLKPYRKARADGDRIYAIIKGSKINQDGETNSITSPSAASQRQLLVDAYREAGVRPDSLGYIEAHGTGTKLGDPIEITALVNALGAEKNGGKRIALGSVKANIGHAATAAGAAGFVKAVLSVKEGLLFPQANYSEINDEIDIDGTGFFVNTNLRRWSGTAQPRRAGVSSFGFSGANCHVIIQQAPTEERSRAFACPMHLATLSAKSEQALMERIVQLRQWLAAGRGNASLFDICFNLNRCRTHFPYRAAFIVRTIDEFLTLLDRAAAGGLDALPYVNRNPQLGRGALKTPAALASLELISDKSEFRQRLDALARSYVAGDRFDWSEFYRGRRGNKLALPGYPFERGRYWMPMAAQENSPAAENVDPGAPDVRYLVRDWRPLDVESLRQSRKTGGTFLLVAREDQVCEEEIVAREFSADRLVVTRETGGSAMGLSFNPDDVSSAASVIDRIGRLGEEFAGVIDITEVAPAPASRPAIKWGKVALLQTLLDRYITTGITLLQFWTADARGAEFNASGAFYAGLVRAVGHEYRKIASLSVKLDDPKDLQVGLRSLRDLDLGRVGAGELKFSDGRPLKPVIRNGAISRGKGSPFAVPDPEGLYVITGAFGGIGRHVANRLIENGARKLVLVVRETALANGAARGEGADPRAQERIEYIDSLRLRGITVHVLNQQVDDPSRLARLLDQVAREESLPYKGVVHCAGTLSSSLNSFIRRNTADMAVVTTPKLDLLLSLARALEEHPLEFFVLCSSVSAGVDQLSTGVMDYAAANYFMDEFARYRNSKGKTCYRSIQWAGWESTGLNTYVSPKYRELGFLQQTADECLDSLTNITAAADVVVLPVRIDPAVFDIDALTGAPSTRPDRGPAPSPVDAAPAGDKAGLAAVKALIQEVLSEELRIPKDRIRDDRNFRELGVDSIILAQLVVKLEKRFGRPMQPAILLEYPSLLALAKHLHDDLKIRVEENASSGHKEARAIPATEGNPAPASIEPVLRSKGGDAPSTARIAVVGMECHFPGAKNLSEYWRNLTEGRDCLSDVPDGRWSGADQLPSGSASMIRRAGFIDGIEFFDPDYFSITSENAVQTDPLIRKFLEIAAQTFRNAGYEAEEVSGREIGVFVGSRVSHFSHKVERFNKGSIVALAQNLIAAHASDFFNLTGPSMVVDTACSSSMTSLVMACRSLVAGDCRMALAGGVDILLDERVFVLMSEAKVLSPDAKCFTFDQRANGFVPGEGCGAVLLKLLPDAVRDGDRIYAVIEASALNNDGKTMGITTPSLQGQQDVIKKALVAGSIDPATISYVETHGTATMIGDPIELKALTTIFREFTKEKQYCAIGSVKTNIGHLLSAAGIASIIKVALALHNKMLPPTLNCEQPNSRFAFETSPFYLARSLAEWKPLAGVRRAGVSSFGFGGGNGHVILADAESCLGDYVARRKTLPPIIFDKRYYWPNASKILQCAPKKKIMDFQRVRTS
jgi:acyl transferase domain-containing protein/NADPH:quinone reductase-like Zn-dependent oxidoreductase/NAD(P)-dependent dehydrogenase (short-subunit alcohol dehydrogenase family)/acyl carrier protein